MYREHQDGEATVVGRPDHLSDGGAAGSALARVGKPAAERGGDLVPAQAAPASAVHGAPRRSRRRLLLGLPVMLAALGLGGWYGMHWWTVGRFMVSTDDAYVGADATTLAAKVSGYVASVAVADNAEVHAGDVIATLDDGDYRLAVQAASDKVATQQATVDRIGRQIPAEEAAVEQARAQLASANAGLHRAQLELDRQQMLVSKDASSRQTLEQAQATRDQAAAGVRSAQAQLDAAGANVDVLKAQRQEAQRTLAELRTALAKAERDLSFTVIRAPLDGVIGNRAMRVGDFVQTGQRLASLVPLDAVYVDANFKETQLAPLHPGQQVALEVDAVPDHAITGTVASLAPASGSVFSLLPTDNATGNFTKIVQRLTVRIKVPDAIAAEHLLRPGMSVVASVDTRPRAGSSNTGMATMGAAQAATRVAQP